MHEYGQFCPISKAAEVLGERWTLLVIRELLLGATRFSELQRALPRMSPTILNRRLGELADCGIIEKTRCLETRGHRYTLTAAGQELQPVLMALGAWGMRWARGEMRDEELDVYQLMQDIERNVDSSQVPDRGRRVVHFEFTDLQEYAHWWLKFDDRDVDLCMQDPGEEERLLVRTDLRCMIEIWMGDRSLEQARLAGRVHLLGLPRYVRTVGTWLGRHVLADVRPALNG